MSNNAVSYSYIFLTDVLPKSVYQLGNGYALNIVKSNPGMFRGFFLDIGEEYKALLAIPHVDDKSYAVYKDLVTFHTFITSNYRTYEFAERACETRLQNSKLTFMKHISSDDWGKIAVYNFDLFPFPTELRYIDAVAQYIKDTDINYRRAFNAFSKLKLNESTKKLYDQICLYVFASCLGSITEIYQNTNLEVSFYVAILESIIGKPEICRKALTCLECNTIINDHYTTSLEKHFKNHFGDQYREMRNIRHKTFHGAAQQDLIGSWLEHYMEEYETGVENKELDRIGKLQVQIGDLGIIVQDRLRTLFFKHYLSDSS